MSAPARSQALTQHQEALPIATAIQLSLIALAATLHHSPTVLHPLLLWIGTR